MKIYVYLCNQEILICIYECDEGFLKLKSIGC